MCWAQGQVMKEEWGGLQPRHRCWLTTGKPFLSLVTLFLLHAGSVGHKYVCDPSLGWTVIWPDKLTG